MYVRNQRLNASQVNPTGSNLTDRGQAAVRTFALGRGELLDGLMSLAGEATVNACGVTVAMQQGHSWAEGHQMSIARLGRDWKSFASCDVLTAGAGCSSIWSASVPNRGQCRQKFRANALSGVRCARAFR